MNPAIGIQSFIEFIVKSLAGVPDQAFVVHDTEDGRSVFMIEVAEEDLNRILGREGRGIDAIRHLATAAGEMHRIEVDIRLRGEAQARKRIQTPSRRR